MDFNGIISEMSAKQTRSFPGEGGNMVSMDFYEMVLDNGLERFACDTNSSSLASQIEGDKLKKGDRVTAILRTQCYPAKTKDGKDFFANRTKIIDIKAEPSGVAPIF